MAKARPLLASVSTTLARMPGNFTVFEAYSACGQVPVTRGIASTYKLRSPGVEWQQRHLGTRLQPKTARKAQARYAGLRRRRGGHRW